MQQSLELQQGDVLTACSPTALSCFILLSLRLLLLVQVTLGGCV
jgi:hypothetical protein